MGKRYLDSGSSTASASSTESGSDTDTSVVVTDTDSEYGSFKPAAAVRGGASSTPTSAPNKAKPAAPATPKKTSTSTPTKTSSPNNNNKRRKTSSTPQAIRIPGTAKARLAELIVLRGAVAALGDIGTIAAEVSRTSSSQWQRR